MVLRSRFGFKPQGLADIHYLIASEIGSSYSLRLHCSCIQVAACLQKLVWTSLRWKSEAFQQSETRCSAVGGCSGNEVSQFVVD